MPQTVKTRDRLRRAWADVFWSRGDRYHCLFCERSYGHFLPAGGRSPLLRDLLVVGAGRRSNARCPHCFSSDRDRLLWLFLQYRTSLLQRPARLLHVAPDWHLADRLAAAPSLEYRYGGLKTDATPDDEATAFDVQALPFDDASFDAVFCNHVMEYVPDDVAGFREIRRILKPEGFAVLQVPIARSLVTTREVPMGVTSREECRDHLGGAGIVRLYGRDYARRVASAGLLVTRHNPYDERWVMDPVRHGLNPREDVYVGRPQVV